MTLPLTNGIQGSRGLCVPPTTETKQRSPIVSASRLGAESGQVGIIREISVGSTRAVEEIPKWEVWEMAVDSVAPQPPSLVRRW